MEYKIETIEDFLNVPSDRIDDCLKEFKTWYDMQQPMTDLLNATKDIVNPNLILDIKRGFTWIDDGNQNITVIFT